MEKLFFGTAGIPKSSFPKDTPGGIKRVAQLGLGCMELEFVRGVYLKRIEAAQDVLDTALKENVMLSVHAPYYINLNSREERKIKASQRMILDSARMAFLSGARSVVFHAGFYMEDTAEVTYCNIKKGIKEILKRMNDEGIKVILRPELSGKPSQFGSLAEILALSSELEGVAPCIDFAHYYARSGTFNSYEDFAFTLKRVEETLGAKALKNLHLHVSGIDYGPKGERKHLVLKDSDFNYRQLLKALADYGAAGLVICESPSLEEDALLLKTTYDIINGKG